MKDLIETYSIQEILLFLVTFALAIKGFVSFWDWGHERLKKVFEKENSQQQEQKSIQEQIENFQEKYQTLENNQKQLKDTLSDLSEKINALIKSDKDDIKSYITEKHHHFCYEKKWIDDYTMDCIEKRYNHYIEEGGNSFIKELMEELRALEKHPPKK